MKLVILGDTHFGGGYALGKIDRYRQVNSRLIDHANTMDHVIDYAADNDVSHLVITGDIYEHRRPEASQQSYFSSKLARLTELGVHTHIVVGNHDIIRAHKSTTIDILKHLRLPNVHVRSEIDSFRCEDSRGEGINLVFFPFRNRQMLQCDSNRKAVEYLKDRLAYEVRGFEKPGPKILIGHFALQGAKTQSMTMDQAASEIVLPLSMFGEFDAVVMGHIHQHQILRRDPLILHLGSMERADFGEAGQPKYFMVVDTDSGEVTYRFLPLPVRELHDLLLDRTSADPDSGIMDSILDEIAKHAAAHKIAGGIVRAEVLVNDRVAQEVRTDRIAAALVKEHGANHCVGVHATIVAKRQLRDADITERIDPEQSFERFLELETDDDLRKRLKKAGMQIIKDVRSRS